MPTTVADTSKPAETSAPRNKIILSQVNYVISENIYGSQELYRGLYYIYTNRRLMGYSLHRGGLIRITSVLHRLK